VSSPIASAASHSDAVRTSALDRLVRSTSAAHAKYRADRCPQLAAAISYHVLFALVPLFTFLATFVGLLLKDEGRRQELIDFIVVRFPLSADAGLDLEQRLSDLPTPASAIGIVSIAVLLWSASGMMASLRVGLSAALDDGSGRPFFHSKLVDVVLVLTLAVLVLVLFGLSIVVNAVERWSETVDRSLDAVGFGRGSVLGYGVPPLLAFGILLILYRFVPASRRRFRDLWVGALLAAVGSELVKLGFDYYLATVASYDVVYGSLGSVFAFLFVVYLLASVVLFGAEFAASWSRNAVTSEAAAGPRVSLPRRLLAVVRGLFVRTHAP
jgi:membrane protein